MVGYLSLLLLVGAAVATSASWQSRASRTLALTQERDVERMLKSLKKHEGSLESCSAELGADLPTVKSCAGLAEDIASLESLIQTGVSEATSLYASGVTIMVDFDKCATESILKQIACYEKVLKKAKALLATATSEGEDLANQATTLIAEIESDVTSCFVGGFSATRFEYKMMLCNLKKMH